jgi:hypothetical protein
MSEHHKHQHVVSAAGSGATIDEAIFNGIAGLTDPQGYHAALTFNSFEVVNIKGMIADNPGDHGTPGSMQVTIQAAGSHRG